MLDAWFLSCVVTMALARWFYKSVTFPKIILKFRHLNYRRSEIIMVKVELY
jgi:hypothetical protein